MLTWFTWLTSFLSGPIVGAIINLYKAKLENQNNTDAQAVDLAKAEIQAEIAARAEANKLLIVEQGRWFTACIRPLFAFPLIIYYWKTIVWDKVLGLGSTDPLNGSIGEWAGWIIVAYFGGRSLEKVAQVFRR